MVASLPPEAKALNVPMSEGHLDLQLYYIMFDYVLLYCIIVVSASLGNNCTWQGK